MESVSIGVDLTFCKRHPVNVYLTESPISDILVSLMMKTSQELMLELGQRARSRRLALDLSQAGLSERSGVSLSVLRVFERTGKISLESLLKLAIALNATSEFETLFQTEVSGSVISMDDLLKSSKQRKRGRTR